MSLRWTTEQYEEYEAKRKLAVCVPLSGHSSRICHQDVSKPDPDKEIDLQAKIERFCRQSGFYFFHDRSRECNAKGFPDLVIALPAGRVVWMELKSAKGRLRPEQKQVRLMLMALGHEWHEVRSYRQFIGIVNGGKNDVQ